MTLLYKADPARGQAWQVLFAEAAPDLPFRLWPDAGDLADIRYLAAWQPSADLVASLPNLEVIFSIGAGVDQFDMDAIPPSVSVVRMVEPGIVQGMVEYAVFATLALHRHMLDYVEAQRQTRWSPIRLVPAGERRVGVLGLGNLGRAVIERLKAFGFPLAAWSRSAHAIEGIDGYAGIEQLPAFLPRTDILICLLPLTPETRGILCRESFAMLPRGAGIINAGRGGHLLEQDLLEALDNGHLSGAVLDVMADEPPAADHPFWHHPRILMTPHIASMTQADSAGRVLIDNIRRHRNGMPMHGLVRRDLGY
jgi:glyoxylate/hydroxypyruvate reductase A